MLSRKKATWLFPMVLAASAWLMPAPAVRAQEIDEAKALNVRAAYLFNFAKFIEWPDDAFEDEKMPFVIGALGDDPFGKRLDATVKEKKIAQREVKTLRLSWSKRTDRAKVKDCHIPYISNSERHRLREIFAALENQPVLLVSDIGGFASDGGMIGFVLEKQRIVFEINRDALEHAELKASAKLLRLARIVKPNNRYKQGPPTVKRTP